MSRSALNALRLDNLETTLNQKTVLWCEMKIALGLLLPATPAYAANAQSYSIDWHMIDGGGSTKPDLTEKGRLCEA